MALKSSDMTRTQGQLTVRGPLGSTITVTLEDGQLNIRPGSSCMSGDRTEPSVSVMGARIIAFMAQLAADELAQQASANVLEAVNALGAIKR
jgi:hypothetical protein